MNWVMIHEKVFDTDYHNTFYTQWPLPDVSHHLAHGKRNMLFCSPKWDVTLAKPLRAPRHAPIGHAAAYILCASQNEYYPILCLQS